MTQHEAIEALKADIRHGDKISFVDYAWHDTKGRP